MNYNDEDGIWRTVGGRRIFIKNGQSVSEAMIESGKFKNKYKKYYTEQLRSIVFKKYVRTKREDMGVFDANNFYIVKYLGNSNYKIKIKLDIEKNREIIGILNEEFENDDFK